MRNNVNHPEHYRAPGKKECIVEMLDIFGKEYVQHFCLLNMYKYRYRHTMKNGVEDLQKAEWYKAKFLELDGNLDEIAKVLKHTEGFAEYVQIPLQAHHEKRCRGFTKSGMVQGKVFGIGRKP